MNDERVLVNGASAATQKIRWLISEPFLGARSFLTTYYDIYSNCFLRPFKTSNKKDVQI